MNRVRYPFRLQRLLLFVATFLFVFATGYAQQQPDGLSVSGTSDNSEAQVMPVDDYTVTESRLNRAMNWLLKSQRQRRADMLERGEFDSLTNATGNEHWQAEAEYRKADYEQAANRFSTLADQSESALYNQATALARAGQLDDSLALYNEILSRQPDHADALHNRDIVEQLKEQAQGQGGQQQNSDENNQSDSGEQDNNQESSESEGGQQQQQDQQQEQSGDQQSGQQQSGDQQDGEQQDAAEQGQQDPEDSGQQSVDLDALSQNQELTEEQQQAREQLEQQALQELSTAEPLSEQQQATEQWLRQIPDDPSGLLRRKLQQTHSTDYPNIRNSSQPW